MNLSEQGAVFVRQRYNREWKRVERHVMSSFSRKKKLHICPMRVKKSNWILGKFSSMYQICFFFFQHVSFPRVRWEVIKNILRWTCKHSYTVSVNEKWKFYQYTFVSGKMLLVSLVTVVSFFIYFVSLKTWGFCTKMLKKFCSYFVIACKSTRENARGLSCFLFTMALNKKRGKLSPEWNILLFLLIFGIFNYC